MSAPISNNDKSIKKFTYIGIKSGLERHESTSRHGKFVAPVPTKLLNKYLEIIGREVMREEIASLNEIEKKLQAVKESSNYSVNDGREDTQYDVESSTNTIDRESSIITELPTKGISERFW